MNYNELNKEDLLKIISDLQRKQKYGLVFEDHQENIVDKTLQNIPILNEVRENCVMCGGQDHILIEGDNYPALLALIPEYKNKINVVYIDPPYNKGNKDFVYNDSFVDKEDTWRHSKWLSFMNRRLKLARELLSDDGVIFISIDDNEQASLKLLCDQVFGENNFVANIIWDHRNSKGNVNNIATIHEYILVYAKNKMVLPKIKVKKKYAKEILAFAKDLFKRYGQEVAQQELRKILKSDKYSGGLKAYNKIDENGRVYQGVTLTAPGSKLFYDVVHPITKKPCKLELRGWAVKKEKMYEMIKIGNIIFGDDEKTIPRKKYYLDENVYESPTTIYSSAANGIDDLPKGIAFDYPKPVSLLIDMLEIAPNTNIVMDCYAGSGSTFQAVAQLNKQDGGNRKCILITNNENNICQDITHQRCKKVIEGYTTPKGKVIPPTNGNLHYYRLNWVEQD